MLKNYAIFPSKYVNITQNYSGPSHKSQSESTNGIKSYPIDIAYQGLYLTSPCDSIKVVKMNGFNNKDVLNQLFLWSTDKVYFANGDYDYITLLVGHINDSDFSSSKIGNVYKRGANIVPQGYDGTYKGNDHLDIVVAKGRQNTWVKNSANEWVLPNSMKPEDVFYIDSNYNKVIKTNGINFKTIPKDAYRNLPTPVIKNTKVDQLEVKVTNLNCRVDHRKDAESVGFIKKGIYNILSIYKDEEYTWYEVEEGLWIANIDSWIEIYVKEEIEEPNIVEEVEKIGKVTLILQIIKSIFKYILDILKNLGSLISKFML